MDLRGFNEVNLTKKVEYKTVPTGSEELNNLLGGGLITNNLVVIQGPSGVGKTTVLQRITLDCIEAGERVLYISAGEQDITELSERFACMYKGIDYCGYVLNKTADKKDVLDAQAEIGDKLVMAYTEDPTTIVNECTELETILDFAVRPEYNIKYIVFDYLGSVMSETEDSQYAFLRKLAGRLKNFATEHNVCIITAMQTNRNFDIEYKNPKFDYKGMGVEFMADSKGPGVKGSVCMTICRDKIQSQIMHIEVWKNRFTGRVGSTAVYIEPKTYKWKLDTEILNGEIKKINGEVLQGLYKSAKPICDSDGIVKIK